MQLQRFILQASDPEYGHPAFEMMFVVERLEELRALLGTAADEDPELAMVYTLDAGDPDGRVTRLSKWIHNREPPYLVHTGFELVLMIDGRKLFARMCESYPPHQHYDEDLFDRHVALGTLHKEVQLEPFAEPVRYRDGRILEGLRTVYYTLKGQEWRIPAWKLVSEASRKSGWNDHFERLEGMLFGYEEWQNDWWLSDIRRRNSRWGALSLYLAVNEDELTAIDDAGRRALPLRSRPLRLLATTWEGAEEEALRSLLEEDGTAAVVRFSVKAGRFLRELASDPQASLHTLSGERVKDLNRLMVGEIEVVMPSAAVPEC